MHEKMSNLSYALLQECYIIHILSTIFIFFFRSKTKYDIRSEENILKKQSYF